MTRRRKLAHLLPLLSLTTLALKCGDDSGPTGPEGDISAAAGTYALVRLNGAALPTATSGANNCTHFIDSGSLELPERGSYHLSLAWRSVCPGTPPLYTGTLQETGKWSVSGRSVTLTRTSGSVLQPSIVTLNGSSAEMRVTLEDPVSPGVPVSLVLQR